MQILVSSAYGGTLSCRETAVGAAADTSSGLRRTEALLSAERERSALLERRLDDSDTSRSDVARQLNAARSKLHDAHAEKQHAERALAQAQAACKTAEGREKVLQAQLEELHAGAAEAQRHGQDAEGARGAAASAAAKESASLSAALRATRARCATQSHILLLYLRRSHHRHDQEVA